MEYKYKRIPFDIELAKKIQAGEIEGRIVRNGHEVIILDYNSKKYSGYPIRIVYLDNDDEVDYVAHEGLHIELPERTPKHGFKPFDKVLVRNEDTTAWICAIFSHMSNTAKYVANCFLWKQCIPYEGNEHLVGTTSNTE